MLHATVLKVVEVLQTSHSYLEDLLCLVQHSLMALLRRLHLNLGRLSRGLKVLNELRQLVLGCHERLLLILVALGSLLGLEALKGARVPVEQEILLDLGIHPLEGGGVDRSLLHFQNY